MALTKEVAKTDEGIRFLEDLNNGKKIYRAHGILGEIPGSDAYVDEEIKPETGGIFLKLYGISYLYKGNPHAVQVHGLELAKSLVFGFTKEIIKRNWLMALSLGLSLIFRRRKVLELLDWIFEEVNHKVVRHYDFKEIEYDASVREIKRAIQVSLREEFNIDLTRPYYDTEHPRFRPERRLPYTEDNAKNPFNLFLGYLIARAMKFFCLFIQSDSAYKFRVQDAFGERPKTIIDFFDILISRETKTGIGGKWKTMRLATSIAFIFIPKIKRFSLTFLRNLDISKVEMDEADWFFCLTYHSYNFGNFLKRERFMTRKEINIEKGHTWLLGYENYDDYLDD